MKADKFEFWIIIIIIIGTRNKWKKKTQKTQKKIWIFVTWNSFQIINIDIQITPPQQLKSINNPKDPSKNLGHTNRIWTYRFCDLEVRYWNLQQQQKSHERISHTHNQFSESICGNFKALSLILSGVEIESSRFCIRNFNTSNLKITITNETKKTKETINDVSYAEPELWPEKNTTTTTKTTNKYI